MTHRACRHESTPSARAACRRERARVSHQLRVEYAHVLGKRILFFDEDCTVCPADEPHSRHYALVRDVIHNPRWAEPMLWVYDECTGALREVGLSSADFV